MTSSVRDTTESMSLPRQAGAKAVLVGHEVDSVLFDVVAAKIRPPVAGPDTVSRTALVNRLRADLSSSAISVVAPGGYGKTTLLAQWAARDDRAFAWISLDRRDNDPLVLLRHVAAAMNEITAVDSHVLDALASPGPSIWNTLMPRIAATIAAAERYVLVLDDAHLVVEGDATEVLTALAEHIPDGSALVVSGRVEPRLAADLRLGGRLLELGADDLGLTRREGELLLRGAGLDLPGAASTELIRKTEGWAGALFLAALSLKKRRDGVPAELEAPFTGDDRYLADYVHSEYLAGLTPERLAFLRQTSRLDKLSGALCDATLDRKESAAELEAIRTSNLFLVPLDTHGEWYRYHHLFRELLLHELFQTDADVVPVLARRAAEWFEHQGDLESALQQVLEIGDTDHAARILVKLAFPTYCSGRSSTVGEWLARFDLLLDRYPEVAVQGAYIHALQGSADEAERWLAIGERASGADPSLAPEIAVTRAAMCRDGVGTMLSDAELALSGLPENSQWWPLALSVCGVAHVLIGDNRGADALFVEAVAAAREIGFDETAVVAMSERMLLSEEANNVPQADAQASAVADILETGRLDTSAPCAIEFATAARLHLRRGDWGEARVLLTRACEVTPMLTEAIPWLAVQTRLELARSFVALRDLGSARTLLREIDDILERRPGLGVLIHQTESLRDAIDAAPTATSGRNSGLTAAELRLLPLLTTHLSFREIGERLFLSRNTIKTQAISVYRKLDVSTRSGAIDEAVRLGLVDEMAQAGTLAHTAS
jgi:LuxR family maltose regulon positive regulatory protein